MSDPEYPNANADYLHVDRRPICAACGDRIDGSIVPARITEDDLIVHYHFECEPDD